MGKTTMILNEMHKNPKALMITFCENDRCRIERENPKLQGRVMTLERYQNATDLRRFDEVHIDNIELCMKIGHRIGLMTMTNYPTGTNITMEKLTIEMCNKYKSCENCPYREESFNVDLMGTEYND